MSQVHLTVTGKDKRPGDVTLFFRRWLANPLQMGSIIPSSPRLGELIARNIDKQSNSLILELGAGTGAITKSLIKAGISPGRIAVVEIVPEMADHLRTKFPKTTVLQADAFNLPNQLLKDSATEIGTVICGIPLVLLSEAKQRQFIQQVELVAPPQVRSSLPTVWPSPASWPANSRSAASPSSFTMRWSSLAHARPQRASLR